MTLPGQTDMRLPNGHRLVSAVRVVEDGARGVLLLAPGRFRLDVTPGQDMFRISVRRLGDAPVTSRSAGHPLSRLESSGIDALDLPLVGAAAMTVEVGDERYDVQVGTLRDPGKGTTTFTAQAVVGLTRG